MSWIDDQGPEPIPEELIDRIMYLGSPPAVAPDGTYLPVEVDGPQAHLAVQGVGSEIPTHFHEIEQFQYFVHGSGTVGSHVVDPGIVHYADRYTPYGPLRPGSAGMTYATMRPRHDTGAFVMPDARAHLAELLDRSSRPAGDRRQHTIDLRAPTREAGEPAQPGWSDLLHEQDGLRVAVTALAGGGRADSVTIAGAGAYALVVEGEVDDEGTLHTAGALKWYDAGVALEAAASPAGARLALLQFPVPATTGGAISN